MKTVRNYNKYDKRYYFKNKIKILQKIKTNNCIDCGEKIKEINKRCRKCWNKFRKGKNSPNWKSGKPKCIDCGKEISYIAKRCVKCATKYKKYNRHHIDMNKNNNKKSNLLNLTRNKHFKLHFTGYEYLVKIGLVKKYIKWFDKKYGLN